MSNLQAQIEHYKRLAEEARISGRTKPTNGETPKPLNYAYYGIGKRFENITIDTLNLESDEYKPVISFAKNIKHRLDNGLGLILKGPVGTGKTCAAIALMRVALDNKLSCYFIPMMSLLDKIMTLRDKDEAYNFEQRLRTTKLLVLDDLGGEYSGKSDWVKSKIAAIIGERYDRKLSTIITTNLTIGQLKAEYDERMIDRLKSTNQLVTLGGDSLRREEWREI